jgi:hypothetical protein
MRNRLKDSGKSKGKSPSTKTPRKKSIVERFLYQMVDGTFLEGVITPSNLPFALFLALIIGLYIANTYNAEHNVRNTSRIEKELKELSSEYITMKSDLMFLSNQSQVAQRVRAIGLFEADAPPHKLFIQSKDSIKTSK